MAEIHEFTKTVPFTIADAILGTGGGVQAIGKEFDLSFKLLKKENKDLEKSQVNFSQTVQPLYTQVKESTDKLEKLFEISEKEKDIYMDRYSEKNASTEKVVQKSKDFNEEDDLNFQATREVANSMQQNLQMMEASLSDIEHVEFKELKDTINKLVPLTDRILAIDETLEKQDYKYYTELMQRYDSQLSIIKKSSDTNKDVAKILKNIEEESGRAVQKETMDSVLKKHDLNMNKFQKGLEKHYDTFIGAGATNEAINVGLSGVTGIIGDMFGVSGLGALGPALFEAFGKNPSDLIKTGLQKVGILKSEDDDILDEDWGEDSNEEEKGWGDGVLDNGNENVEEEEEDWGYETTEKLDDIENQLEEANATLNTIAGLEETEVDSIDEDERSDDQLLAELKASKAEEKELNANVGELTEVAQDILAQAQDDREESDWQFKQQQKKLGEIAKAGKGGLLDGLGGVKGKFSAATKFIKPVAGVLGGAAAIFGASKLAGAAGKKIGGEKGELVGETVGKTGARTAAIAITKKSAAKTTAKTAGKTVAKKIPLVGAAAGIGFSIGRFKEGDVLGGIGEIASGLASIVPVFGTAASVAIDGALLARDLTNSGKDAIESAEEAINAMPESVNDLSHNTMANTNALSAVASDNLGDVTEANARALANLDDIEKVEEDSKNPFVMGRNMIRDAVKYTPFGRFGSWVKDTFMGGKDATTTEVSSRIKNMQSLPVEMQLAKSSTSPSKGTLNYATEGYGYESIDRNAEIALVSGTSPYSMEYINDNIVLPHDEVDNSLIYEEIEKERLLTAKSQPVTTTTTPSFVPPQQDRSTNPSAYKPDDVYLTLLSMKAFNSRSS